MPERLYEDTLVEMEDAAKECGFRVVAAVAAVAEHSILPQYATGRPDETDKAQLADFATKISGKDSEIASLPGNRPYKKSGGAGLVPKPTKDCVKCGLCAEKCPVQAIDPVSFAAAGVLDYCMDPNRIVPKIDPREFDLSQINDALQLVPGGHINGKVILRFP